MAAPAAPGEPGQRLPRQALTAWRLSAAGGAIPVVVAGLALSAALGDAPHAVALAPAVLAVLGALVAVLVVPELRWRRWRYEVREEEIDLRHGALTVRRTLVPMARVQHVDTERGPLQQSLGLSTVAFHTAAGKTAIPQLAEAEADRVRDRIAALARTRDLL